MDTKELEQLKKEREELLIPEEMHSSAEEEMRGIGAHVEQARIPYERSNADLPHNQKEIWKKGLELHEKTNEITPERELSYITDSEKMKNLEDGKKLQELVNVAFTKSPIDAIAIAKDLKNPWLEDELHRVLSEQYGELVKRGKLKL